MQDRNDGVSSSFAFGFIRGSAAGVIWSGFETFTVGFQSWKYGHTRPSFIFPGGVTIKPSQVVAIAANSLMYNSIYVGSIMGVATCATYVVGKKSGMGDSVSHTVGAGAGLGCAYLNERIAAKMAFNNRSALKQVAPIALSAALFGILADRVMSDDNES